MKKSKSETLKQSGIKSLVIIMVTGGLVLPFATKANATPLFQINDLSSGLGNDALALQLFTDAANEWGALFDDQVTINLDFNMVATVAVAAAPSVWVQDTYGNFTTAITADRTTPDDFTAVANLPVGTANAWTNLTFENTGVVAPPLWDGTPSPNNNNTAMSRANAKALGLIAARAPGLDGTGLFSNVPGTFDFNAGDGIGVGLIDFYEVALHEVGHLLGFNSLVTTLDVVGGPGISSDNWVLWPTPLDYYRYTNQPPPNLARLDGRHRW